MSTTGSDIKEGIKASYLPVHVYLFDGKTAHLRFDAAVESVNAVTL